MSPKHIWSGDWRAEADAEADERRRRGDQRGRLAPDDAPTTVGTAASPAAAAQRRRNTTALVVVSLLAIAVAGFAAVALIGGGDDNKTADTSNTLARPAPLPAVASTPVRPRAGRTRAGQIYAAASPAVVSIRTSSGTGTGFLVDDSGTLVTNDHVVGDSKVVAVKFGTDGATIRGDVRGTDPSSDLAVVHIDPNAAPADARPLQFADSRGVAVGDTVIAIGNPFGLDRTATEGIVSSLGRTLEAPNHFQIDDVIQTDAAINPGNSGGPLLDDGGHVIGVNSQIATNGVTNGNVGIGFAVPSNTVRQVLPALREGKTVSHAWLGVETGSATNDPSQPSDGATVTAVTPGGPADDAGVHAGDVITSIDGQDITDPTVLSTVINNKAAGDHVALTIRRGGSRQDIDVQLRERPAQTP